MSVPATTNHEPSSTFRIKSSEDHEFWATLKKADYMKWRELLFDHTESSLSQVTTTARDLANIGPLYFQIGPDVPASAAIRQALATPSARSPPLTRQALHSADRNWVGPACALFSPVNTGSFTAVGTVVVQVQLHADWKLFDPQYAPHVQLWHAWVQQHHANSLLLDRQQELAEAVAGSGFPHLFCSRACFEAHDTYAFYDLNRFAGFVHHGDYKRVILVAPESFASLSVVSPHKAQVTPGGSVVAGLMPMDVVAAGQAMMTLAPLQSLTWERAKSLVEFVLLQDVSNSSAWSWSVEPIQDRDEFSGAYLEAGTSAVAVVTTGRKQVRQALVPLGVDAGAWIWNSLELEDLSDAVRVTLVPVYPPFHSGIRKQARIALPPELALIKMA
jgi:hypothetical protein